MLALILIKQSIIITGTKPNAQKLQASSEGFTHFLA